MAAILDASSLESTSWKLPKTISTSQSITGVATEHAAQQGLFDALLDPPGCNPSEIVPPTISFSIVWPLAAFGRAHNRPRDVTVLTATTGLLDQLADAMGPALVIVSAIGNLRLAPHWQSTLKLAEHAVPG